MSRIARLLTLLATPLLAGAILLAPADAQARKRKSPPAEDAPAAQPAAPAPAPKLFDLPHLQRQLDNGLVVIVVKAPFKGTVSVQIPVQTGARNEVEPGKSGFAHFFEHMMFRGTDKFPPAAYSAVIQGAGADQNAYTADDFTNYYLNFTTEDLDRVLEVEADRFANLKYTEEQFRTEALAVKGEYLKNFSNPVRKGAERLQALAFTQHTYQHTGMGFLEDIEDMPNELAYSHEFFQRWYRPEYASVIVVGDVELEPTFELVKKHFGGWQRGSYKVEIPQEPAQDKPRYEHFAWEGPTLPWLLVGWKSPAFSTTTPDPAALTLGAEVWFGESSALYQQLVVRDRMVDQLSYEMPLSADPSLLVLAARLTDAKHAAAVTAAINQTLTSARTQLIDAQLLADTKSRLRYSFAQGMNSAAAIGGVLATFVRHERDLETLNRFYATFDALDATQVRDAARRVFTNNNRTAVSIAQAPSLPGADAIHVDEAAALSDVPAGAKAEAPPAGDEKKKPENQLDAFTRLTYEQRATARLAEEMRFSVPVYEQHTDSPLVDIVVLFKPGASLDPPGKKGLTYLAASMLAQAGTVDHSYEEIQRALYPLATGLTLQVDKEMIRYSATVHRDNLAQFWQIATAQITTPGFRQEDFDRLKQQQLNAIRVSLRANNDEELGKEALYEQAYGNAHPYGTLNLGHARDVAAITLDDVKEFWSKNLLRGRLSLGIAGGYSEEFRTTMLAPLARVNYVRPVAPKVEPAAASGKRRAVIIAKDATPAVAVSFGAPLTIRRGDPDWLALWLARSWLGEHRNASGRLYDTIREQRGMNYGDYAYVEYFPNGMFQMRPTPNVARQNDLLQVWLRPLRDNNDAVFATRAALYEIDRLVKHGLTAEQFEGQRAFLRKFVLNLTATQADQLGYMLDSQFYGTPEFTTYARDGLAALTLEQVNAAIRKHFKPDSFTFVFVAKDAAGLKKLLTGGQATPIKYNTDKPAAIVAEDRKIASFPLGLAAKAVEIVPEAQVFE